MIDAATHDLVWKRAGNCCEYCRLHEFDEPFATLHVEHIIAKQHGGLDVENNLALACHYCNRRKGPNLTGIDPETGSLVQLFNPRTDHWHAHFVFKGPLIVGTTTIGRATARLLGMNDENRIVLRSVVH